MGKLSEDGIVLSTAKTKDQRTLENALNHLYALEDMEGYECKEISDCIKMLEGYEVK